MLALAAAQTVKSWIVKKPIEEANVVVVKVHQEGARYRYVRRFVFASFSSRSSLESAGTVGSL